ncbi:hypothetical protein GYMLUDRAFT_935954 [Collybiopsis luxurians FD-317 M1]|uniref:Uncharacterized protein n=1 Tax=Collybiopsis luxurians FD-317 M1 TaxID=944289 RepID=A0A0D0BV92_9AGAR|nr:hypothetical protein GYMLUDRAFT_935954 [Collybiopsis luxurians FD-317 M1]
MNLDRGRQLRNRSFGGPSEAPLMYEVALSWFKSDHTLEWNTVSVLFVFSVIYTHLYRKNCPSSSKSRLINVAVVRESIPCFSSTLFHSNSGSMVYISSTQTKTFSPLIARLAYSYCTIREWTVSTALWAPGLSSHWRTKTFLCRITLS